MQSIRLLHRLHDPVGGLPRRLGPAAACLCLVLAAVAAGPALLRAASSGPYAGDELAPNRPDTGQLTIAIARVPTVTLSPAFGSPGTLTTVTGANFTGTTPLILRWSAGVPYTPPNRVVTRDDGTFVTQFLVLSGDGIYGPRLLQVFRPVFGIAEGFSLPSARLVAQAQFTVVPHPAGPPTSILIHTPWGTRPFTFRP